jgi:uncharacterized protein (DUF924 family)
MTPGAILAFWFDEAGPKRWFGGGPQFDAQVRRRFGSMVHGYRTVRTMDGHPWMAQADSALALVLVLDQFPRNIWRGSNAAFSLDALGLEAARLMLEAGHDMALADGRRVFAYMPFMHSEALADQELCVRLCEERLPAGNDTLRHARAHRDIIAMFGRFPYRNAVLGRADTPEEAAWLAADGYRPG